MVTLCGLSRLVSLCSSAALVAATAAAPGAVTPAAARGRPTVQVHGRLLVVPAEAPGRPAGVRRRPGRTATSSRCAGASRRTSAPVRRSTGACACPPTSCRGPRRGAVSRAPTAALRLVDRPQSLALRRGRDAVGHQAPPVATTPAPPTRSSSPPSTTRALSAQNDTQLLGHVTHRRQLLGRASPTARSPASRCRRRSTHYDTDGRADRLRARSGRPTSSALVQEAAAQFPGHQPVRRTDQLVVFVPAACSSGSDRRPRARSGRASPAAAP